MNDAEQRIAIAHATGQWKDCRIIPGGPHDFDMPVGKPFLIDGTFADEEEVVDNYPTDLNAMHEAEKHLGLKYDKWTRELRVICLRDRRCIESATAAQRAEAFLRTLDLWKP